MKKKSRRLLLLFLSAVMLLTSCSSAPAEATTTTEKTSAVTSASAGKTTADTTVQTVTTTTATTAMTTVANTSVLTSTFVSPPEQTTARSAAQTTVTTTVRTTLPPEAPAQNGYVHVSGDQIVDENGSVYIIKGIAFGNGVWGNPSTPLKTHHNEQSYKELAEMGFNSVRFYLNYGLFESDSNPYKYKQSGFDWLDANIEWAKKYGIKLVLNMHYPQGGYQSQGNGTALWLEEANRKRLTALWKEIARRYADETTIIGYGLINEPGLPELGSYEKTIGQCRGLMQQITDEIRTVDKNHIVFIERPISVKDVGLGTVDWEKYSFDTMTFIIDDDNAVYEFHFYDPMTFTHQNAEWAGTAGSIMSYGGDDVIIDSIDNYWVTFAPGKRSSVEGEWSRFETDYFTATDSYNIGTPVMQGSTVGSGTAYYDDITVTEYTSAGKATGKVIKYDFSDSSQADKLNMWSENGSGSSGYSADVGYAGAGCVYITGTTGDASMSCERFPLLNGYKYKVTGMVKTVNVKDANGSSVRCDFAHCGGFYRLDSEYLEAKLSQSIDFGKKNGVPVYIGEFGAISASFMENRGGEKWVSDMLDLMKKYGISFNYHTYHEPSFGLYTDYDSTLPTKINTLLEAVFREKLKTI